VSLPDPSLVAHLEPRVHGVPPLSPEQGRKYLGACRISLQLYLPTDLPAGPLLLLDAMAMGKAVVVSDVNGTRDYVTDGTDAIVVSPRDVVAAADAVARLMQDRALRDRLGHAARSRAVEFSQTDFMDALLIHALPAHPGQGSGHGKTVS
jgi:glycosyltransferase involved in cell wall biosynthesis